MSIVKKISHIFYLVPFILFACHKKETAYLAQQLPGSTPEIFAPGLINTDSVELNAVFNNSMTEFFFTRMIRGSFVIHHSELLNGQWSFPEAIQMFPEQDTITVAVDMSLSPDGNTMYFLGQSAGDLTSDIYVSHKRDGKWQFANKLPEPVSTEKYEEWYPLIVNDGSLYFVSDRPGGIGKRDIYRAQYLGDGKFDTPVSLGPVVNSAEGSGDTYVAPDESYLISNTRRPESGLYIAFRKENEWQEPIYLGEPINSDQTDFCPYMSPDGRYFFFSRRYSDPPDSGWNGVTKGEIYWMDANSIFRLQEGK